MPEGPYATPGHGEPIRASPLARCLPDLESAGGWEGEQSCRALGGLAQGCAVGCALIQEVQIQGGAGFGLEWKEELQSPGGERSGIGRNRSIEFCGPWPCTLREAGRQAVCGLGGRHAPCHS